MKCELCGREIAAGTTACAGCGNAPTTADRTGRRWWQKKRWRSAALLSMAYPFSLWPVTYLMGVGVVATPSRAVAIAYAPLWPVIYTHDGVRPGFEWFIDGLTYFHALGQQHAA